MNFRKHGRRLAGLVAVAALAMMAFASMAQGEGKKVEFYVNGALAPANLHVELGGNQVGTANALLLPIFKLEIKCKTFSVQQGFLLGPHKLEGKLLFEGCEVFKMGDLGLVSICHVIASTTDFKLHVTATGKILPAELLNGGYAVLAEEIVANIRVLSGTECPLPVLNTVTGEVCLALDNNHVTPLLLLSNDEIQGLCRPRTALNSLLELTKAGTIKDKLLYGAQESFLDVHLNVFGKVGTTHQATKLGVLLAP